jgi:DNA-binding LytR/AlgR family response regulator
MSASEFQDQKVNAQQAARIAFKANGSILLLDLADISAVQAEGNYVSLQHRPNPYLVHESLSSMVEKLKPYGFIRIHRSVVVNISAVEEIQPLPTGEYRLRVKGGIRRRAANVSQVIPFPRVRRLSHFRQMCRTSRKNRQSMNSSILSTRCSRSR